MTIVFSIFGLKINLSSWIIYLTCRCMYRLTLQTVCDDKSGYDHIFLTEESRTLFGFEWRDWYFTSNTLPFDCMETIGSRLSYYRVASSPLLPIRWHSLLALYCSDDRHSAQLIIPEKAIIRLQAISPDELDLTSANMAYFIVYYTLVAVGYFLGLAKSILIPQQVVPYLGFLCNSRLQAFTLIPSKKQKFFSSPIHPRERFYIPPTLLVKKH